MLLRKKIEEYCFSLGLDTIGFIPCREFTELRSFLETRKVANNYNEFEEKDIHKRITPKEYMPGAKTIISIAFPYANECKESENGFSLYTKRLDYHVVVKSYLNRICSFIESLGGKASGFVDSNALPERYIAYLAGLGFIGRNQMLITRKYGSYVFLGEIITDINVLCKDERNVLELAEYKECGACLLCTKSCPVGALQPKGCSANQCISYLSQKKELTEEELTQLHGRIFGCDGCQLVCPYNRNTKGKGLLEFHSLEAMDISPEAIASMDNKTFRAVIKATSSGWRGKNILRRNAILRLALEQKNIDCYLGESEYVNQYIMQIKRQL